MKELETTSSVCPACFQEGKIHKIDAKVIEDDGKVWIAKKCKQHGEFKDIYFGDIALYERWMKYAHLCQPIISVRLRGSLHTQSVLTTLLFT
jgi:uncharacterized radical SAM superfamily Fe-S cluster-containing enzyme